MNTRMLIISCIALLLVSTGGAFAQSGENPTATAPTAEETGAAPTTTSTTTPTPVSNTSTATASAPTETTTPEATPSDSESSNSTTYYGDVSGDPLLRIVDAEYRDGTAIITLEADAPRLVTVTAPTGSTSAGVSDGNIVRKSIPKGRSTIRIASPEPRLTITTSTSIRNGKYTEIRFEDGSALISGPFTGKDVRDAAIGGTLGTAFVALLVIVRRRFGLHKGMERVA